MKFHWSNNEDRYELIIFLSMNIHNKKYLCFYFSSLDLASWSFNIFQDLKLKNTALRTLNKSTIIIFFLIDIFINLQPWERNSWSWLQTHLSYPMNSLYHTTELLLHTQKSTCSLRTGICQRTFAKCYQVRWKLSCIPIKIMSSQNAAMSPYPLPKKKKKEHCITSVYPWVHHSSISLKYLESSLICPQWCIFSLTFLTLYIVVIYSKLKKRVMYLGLSYSPHVCSQFCNCLNSSIACWPGWTSLKQAAFIPSDQKSSNPTQQGYISVSFLIQPWEKKLIWYYSTYVTVPCS